mmetsp:Transcript_18462/g.22490  ORF Transcript_18462/g.22490 Transcript_18462/m.22490 type:complete len:402 (+) Transcript_18462:113-1318(+)
MSRFTCTEVLVDLVDDRFGKYVPKHFLAFIALTSATLYVSVAISSTILFYRFPAEVNLEVLSVGSASREIEPSSQSFKRIGSCTTSLIKDETVLRNTIGSIEAIVGRFEQTSDPTCLGEPNVLTNECPSLLFSGPAGRITKLGSHILSFADATALSLSLFQCANDINTPSSCDDTESYEYLDLSRGETLSLFTPTGLLDKATDINADLSGSNSLVQNLRTASLVFKTFDMIEWRYEIALFIDEIVTTTLPDNTTQFEYDLDFEWCFKTDDKDSQELKLCNSFFNERVQCDTSLSFCLPVCASTNNCTMPRDIIQRHIRRLFTAGSFDILLNYIKKDFRNKHFMTCETETFLSFWNAVGSGYGLMGYFIVCWSLLLVCMFSCCPLDFATKVDTTKSLKLESI